jgi:hypothetical protein
MENGTRSVIATEHKKLRKIQKIWHTSLDESAAIDILSACSAHFPAFGWHLS